MSEIETAPVSVRDSLNAAMSSFSAEDPPAAPVIETPPVETASADTLAEAAPEGAAPERDEHGRFKPKADQTAGDGAQAAAPPATIESEPAKPAGQEPQPEAIRVPPSLPAAVKAKFAALDPDVQQAFGKLEDSVQQSKAEWGKKGERLNRYEEIVGPHVDRWRMAGLDEFSGVQTLLAAQSVLERNPVDGIIQIARSYGLTPAHLAQAFGLSQTSGQTPGPEGFTAPTAQPDVSAALEPFMREFRTFQQQFTQTQQTQEAQKLSEAQAAVAEFSAKPENMYFENVREDVARRLETGAARNLQDAYDQAVWADPSIRPHLIDAQTKAATQAQEAAAETARKQAEAAAREKARVAMQAGGSVTGSPAPGAQPGPGAIGSVRDTLRAAMQEHGAPV